MTELSFLGITKTDWDFINSFSNWLSAIGTVSAVWVALYLAKRATTQKAKVTVGHRIMIQLGDKGPIPEFVVFNIINTGERSIRVTQIGWKVGLWNKRHAIHEYAHPPPPKTFATKPILRWILTEVFTVCTNRFHSLTVLLMSRWHHLICRCPLHNIF